MTSNDFHLGRELGSFFHSLLAGNGTSLTGKNYLIQVGYEEPHSKRQARRALDALTQLAHLDAQAGELECLQATLDRLHQLESHFDLKSSLSEAKLTESAQTHSQELATKETLREAQKYLLEFHSVVIPPEHTLIGPQDSSLWALYKSLGFTREPLDPHTRGILKWLVFKKLGYTLTYNDPEIEKLDTISMPEMYDQLRRRLAISSPRDANVFTEATVTADCIERVPLVNELYHRLFFDAEVDGVFLDVFSAYASPAAMQLRKAILESTSLEDADDKIQQTYGEIFDGVLYAETKRGSFTPGIERFADAVGKREALEAAYSPVFEQILNNLVARNQSALFQEYAPLLVPLAKALHRGAELRSAYAPFIRDLTFNGKYKEARELNKYLDEASFHAKSAEQPVMDNNPQP